MSHLLISRSPHLQRLCNEGYNLEINNAFLLIRDIPYVNSGRQIQRGVLVMAITLMGDVVSCPSDHTTYFIGDIPCDSQGRPLEAIINNSCTQHLTSEIVVNHYFSAKPRSGAYADYYEKVSLYVAMLCGHAQALDPNVTAQTFLPIKESADEGVFGYRDTASARAGITALTDKFKNLKIAIVGLGGTGSYILDQVTKTPVAEIHLYDGDMLHQHNAFRYPGAVPFETFKRQLKKVEYLQEMFGHMHRGIKAHPCMITEENVTELLSFDYVFLSVDKASVRELVVRTLRGKSACLIDVGMGVHLVAQTQKIWGICRVTTLTSDNHDHAEQTIPLTENTNEDAYRTNIQIADLNSLNAMLAVGQWKRLSGFYADNVQSSQITYTTNTNLIGNSESKA